MKKIIFAILTAVISMVFFAFMIAVVSLEGFAGNSPLYYFTK